MSEKRIINTADLTLREVGDGRGFSARVGRAGPLIGSSGIGCSLVVVAPGKSACPFHRHHVWDELFLILEGEGVTRLDGETLPIRAGDIIAAPAGKEAHQIINTGPAELRYLALSADRPADIIEYPDSGKIAVDAGFVPGSESLPALNLSVGSHRLNTTMVRTSSKSAGGPEAAPCGVAAMEEEMQEVGTRPRRA